MFQAWNFLRALLFGHFAGFRTLLSPTRPELAAQRPLQQARGAVFENHGDGFPPRVGVLDKFKKHF
jgi:hypothetical protein